jgi:hypothetical protein
LGQTAASLRRRKIDGRNKPSGLLVKRAIGSLERQELLASSSSSSRLAMRIWFASLSPAIEQPPEFRVDLLSDSWIMVCRFSRGSAIHSRMTVLRIACLFVVERRRQRGRVAWQA